MDDGETVRISWHGDVDLRNITEVRAEIARAAATPGLGTLVIDLTAAEFIDSLGVGALIQARDQCADAGAHLVLFAVPRRTRHLLTAAGLDTMFSFADPDQ